ncbi:hypothetical protein Gotri_005907, partial [Gossypium trilobum]|nr:hypothetical protein [Gossypium trilobum]
MLLLRHTVRKESTCLYK